MRWFNVVHFENREIQACLDAIILLANPDEKLAAHITLQGPFKNITDAEKIGEVLKGIKISVLGVSKFFDENQNTVFLECGSDYLRKYWKKPHFKYRPHITLYDGPSREFAEKLFSRLKSHKLFFTLSAGKVTPLSSVSGQKSFDLWFGIDTKEVSRIAGEPADVYQAKSFPEWKRLMIIDRCCNHLTWLAQQNEREKNLMVNSKH